MNNQLNEINEKFKLIFENVEDLFFLYNLKPNPKFEYVSPSSLNISGYTPEEYYNNPDIFNKLVHTDDMALFEFIKENFKIIKKPIIIRWICKDGKIIWTEQKFVSILDKKGDLKAIQGVIRDITKKKGNGICIKRK